MKTKPTDPIPTAFPTCGEVFYFLINAIDLTAWADAFNGGATKRQDPSERKTLNDQLRDWATESEGRAPRLEELEKFIRDEVRDLPRANELAFILCHIWGNVLGDHVDEVRENATYLDRNGTRAWYAQAQAPRLLYFLWVTQKLLRRMAQAKGPMLDASLDYLLTIAWPKTTEIGVRPIHPLHLACYKHYAEIRKENSSLVDPKTLAAWKSGEDRPSCAALGRHFAEFPDKLGLLLNFAFAGLLEAVANTLRNWILPSEWPDCRQMLLDQARCMYGLDELVAEELTRSPELSLRDHEKLLARCLGGYMEFLKELQQISLNALDLRVAKFRVYENYQRRIAERFMPEKFDEFNDRLKKLWQDTALKSPRYKRHAVAAELVKMRAEHPDWCVALAGPLLAIEARIALCHETPSQDSLQQALGLYQDAFAKSRYQAGIFTTQIAREAMGLAALLHRRETGEGAIKPWIKKVLSWWDLLGLGAEFNHERLEQRIELAESRFTDVLNIDVRARLKAALPGLGLSHFNIGGLAYFTAPGVSEQLQESPVDRRQKKPMTKTLVGRDQTSLMEAIDRGQLDLARELVRKGADLNFINSTGDTCVTKAFARQDYDLVLVILRRDHEPIRRETLLRVTNKKKISGLEQTISLGQVEILRELTRWKSGRGEIIDMNAEKIWGQTPLYYAVNCLAHFRMSPQEAIKQAMRLMPESVASSLRPENLEALRERLAKDENPDGILKCIDCFINELRVNLDAPNVNDNTPLTYAVESRMHDVAALLLAAGASVNHRFQGGGTALVRAILNDDYEMAKLLLEYSAEYRLFVDGLGRPIYTMPMSEKIRRLIPERL